MIVEYRLKDFINKDLKVFSNSDNVRSIPSLIDGFKDSQRKAVYGLFQHGNSEIKVAQLGGAASLASHYEHGEDSMSETIVGLAQSFTGSNNVNLFEPIGQFGSILSSEASAPRYIFTKPSINLRKYLRKEDDIILEHRLHDGDVCEPLSYFPIVPMWLVNGASGIGTGHSVKIMSRDPVKVIDLVSKMVQGVTPQQRTIDAAMTPYFHGWKGQVIKGDSDTQWEFHGNISKVNSTTLLVDVLPITYDVDKFKSILIQLMDENIIKDFENDSSESGFKFTITTTREVAKKDIKELKALFKLVAKVGENVTLWDVTGTLKRFDNVHAALVEFVEFRKQVYKIRKTAMLEQMNSDIDWLEAKIAFIDHWNNKAVLPHKMNNAELMDEFKDVVDQKYMERLLTLSIRSLTIDKVLELMEECASLRKEHAILNHSSLEDLYLSDLKSV